MSIKDIITEGNGLILVDQSPVQKIDKDDMVAAVNRMRAIVPNGEKMSVQALTIIANEAILYRVVPGRDMHYYESKNGLVRIPDYKYLKNVATFKEQLLSGDDTATIEDNYYVLDEAGKSRHSIPQHCIAAECRITTKRERLAFAAEVRQWIDLGFKPKEAIEIAKETYGEIGSSAIGVYDPKELDRWGKPIQPPKGWSPLQVAEKLAFKNAINRKYGIPTADEMSAMAHRMARRAMPEHWRPEHSDKPVDIQARLADLEAVVVEVDKTSADMTIEDHHERLEENVEMMRGPGIDEDIIEGEAEEPDTKPAESEKPYRFPNSAAERFYNTVQRVTESYYKNPYHLIQTIGGTWFDFGDQDLWGQKLDYAISHAQERWETQQEMELGDRPQGGAAYSENS